MGNSDVKITIEKYKEKYMKYFLFNPENEWSIFSSCLHNPNNPSAVSSTDLRLLLCYCGTRGTFSWIAVQWSTPICATSRDGADQSSFRMLWAALGTGLGSGTSVCPSLSPRNTYSHPEEFRFEDPKLKFNFVWNTYVQINAYFNADFI